MKALVSTCLLPSKEEAPLQLPEGQKSQQEEALELEEPKEMMSSSTADESAPSRPLSECVVVQSPSRARARTSRTNEETKKKEIPLYYSPLCEGYQDKPTTASHHTIPNAADLMCHASRWEYQATLAGDHQQSPHVLDVSRRRIQLCALQFGVTPLMAEKITDFRFNRNSVGRHELPAFFSSVGNLFPNLKRLTLNGTGEMIKATNTCKNETYNSSPDKGKIYSADGSDDERSLGDAQLLANFDASIAMVQRESDHIQRLYILYRLPSLLYINGKMVTDEERKLARPNSPSGHKDKSYDWVNQIELASTKDQGQEPMKFYCTEEEDNGEDWHGESFEVPLNSMIELMRKGDSSPELIDCIRNERRRLSCLSTGSSSSSCSSERKQFDSIPDTPKLRSPTAILRMFPRTGRSIATKSTNYATWRPALSKIESTGTVVSNDTTPEQLESSKPKNSEVDTAPKIETVGRSLPTSPKHNLAAFLQKGNSRDIVNPKISQARSEATDVAIAGAGRLLSKMSLKIDRRDTEKENIRTREQTSGNDETLKKQKKSLPLVGSMVKVKLKRRKGKVHSRPPPSPASAMRSFPAARRKFIKSKSESKLPSVSLMDDDDDEEDDDDSTELAIEEGVINERTDESTNKLRSATDFSD